MFQFIVHFNGFATRMNSGVFPFTEQNGTFTEQIDRFITKIGLLRIDMN